MRVERAYKTELAPNDVERTLLLRHCGAARWAYNWGLQRNIDVHRMNRLPVAHIKRPTAVDLHRELNLLKKTTVPWMYEVSKCAPQEALRDLDRAFHNFFEGRSRFPNFKSKKRGLGTFRLTGSIRASEDRIQLPRLGRIRLKEPGYIPTGRPVRSATVSERAGRWFVSIAVERELVPPANVGPACGVDLGVARLATVSDGEVIENPSAIRRFMRKVTRLQREVSRKARGSKNRKKARNKFATVKMREANIRRDALHKATTLLARSKSVIVIEDLNVRGMAQNHAVARGLADASFGEFRRQLEYKTRWYGSTLVIAPPFYPSSKMCSRCGHVKKQLRLSERVFVCEECGSRFDRDLNAAVNLLGLAASSAESENACLRREVAGSGENPSPCPSMRQEANAAIRFRIGG